MTCEVRRCDRRREGFVLPMVIITVFVLAGGLAAGFTMSRSERAIDDAGRADIFAQSNAETALQRAMAERVSLGLSAGTPPANDSVRVNISNGYADVVVTRIREAVGSESAVYLVRAHGFSTASRVAGTPAAQYTVTQMASWQAGRMTVRAAFLSITGIQKNGASGRIDGTDDCGGPPVAGVAVPDNPSYTQSGGGRGGWSSVLAGTPLVDSTMGATPSAMAPNVGVDWANIVGGGLSYNFDAIPPWSHFTANPTSYPVIWINNSAASPVNITQGRGLLVIRNNAVISGSDVWNGVVLVGGTLTSNGNNTVNGALITGLNIKLGEAVSVNSVGNGTKDFSYNSCYVNNAVAGMGRMKVFKNTWSNTYAVY